MGCDIHSRLEILRPAGWNGAKAAHWECVSTPLFENGWYSADRPLSDWNAPMRVRPLSYRNYRLFAMLADVRNGDRHDGGGGDWVQPIADPKGVPWDASEEWKQEAEEWGGDMHSHSFFTLAELDAYNWGGIVFNRGYITEEQYLVLRGTNDAPQSWSGGVGGGNILAMTAIEYEDALALGNLAKIKAGDGWGERKIYVQYQWSTTRYEEMGELKDAMEIMRDYQPGANATPENPEGIADPEAIRVVFGFDN